MILRQLCRYCLKGICTSLPCEYLYPPECHFYKTETGRAVGETRLFPHHKDDEQPNKKPKKGFHSHKGRASDDKKCCRCCEKCTTIGLRLARLGSIGLSNRQTAPGNPMQKSLGTDSKNTVHSVYATSCKYPGNIGPSLGKIQVKNPHQRSTYAIRFEDRSHQETERQERCAQSKAWNLAKNIFKLKEKGQDCILLACGKVCTPCCVNQRGEEREFCGGFHG